MHMMEKTRHGWRKTQSLVVQLAELNIALVMGNVYAGSVDGWVPNCALVFKF